MTSLKRNYELALAALEELTDNLVLTDIRQDKTEPSSVQLATTPLQELLDNLGRLPPASLFLGAAYDGLPVLLNLNDPTPGPILITADHGSGKTAFLQTVSQASSFIHTPETLQFGVITEYPEEWDGFEDIANCMGVFPSYESSANDFILSLAGWAHNNHQEERFALLIIDNFEMILKMDENVQQNLRWLLLRGPNRRVWPLVSLNTNASQRIYPWLDAFRTKLFGAIKNVHGAVPTLPKRDAALHLLEPGLEFILNENRQWVKFWVPPIKKYDNVG